jgi:hypothetical protein
LWSFKNLKVKFSIVEGEGGAIAVLEEKQDSEKQFTALGRLWRYELNGLFIVPGGTAFYIQYHFGMMENTSFPLLGVFSMILIIELVLLSVATGVLNHAFAQRYWSLVRKESYLTMTVKGFFLVGLTLIIVGLSTPVYFQNIWPPIPYPRDFELWNIFWFGLLSSIPTGILARPIAFYGHSSQASKEKQLLS